MGMSDSDRQGPVDVLGLLGVVFFMLCLQSNIAQAQATPCNYKWNSICYETQVEAEAAMKATDWLHDRLVYDHTDADGNYVYSIPPTPHLPPVSWGAEFFDGNANAGFYGPAFATYAEAYDFLVDRAAIEGVSTELVHRGDTNIGGLTKKFFSDTYTQVPVTQTDLEWPYTTPSGGCSSYPDYSIEANVTGFWHYGHAPDSLVPWVAKPSIVAYAINNCRQPDDSWYRIFALPVLEVAEGNVGLCKSPYYSDGMQCVNDLTATIEVGPFHVLGAPSECSSNGEKSDRTNPCDLSSGNKLQVETDYAGTSEGSLSFSRYYNSTGPFKSAENSGAGWRHTYSRALDERPDKDQLKFIGVQSSSYSSDQEACETGWDDIKASVWGGDLSSATAVFVGGSSCEISSGGSVAAIFPVKDAKSRGIFVPAITVHTITRPNGAVHHFKSSGGNWVNELNPSLTLEVSGSDWIFTNTNDTQETYNASGQLTSITYRNGQTETLEYNLTAAQGGDDDASTLDRVTGAFGHTLTLAYDVNDRLESVTTPDGTTQYGYDAENNLISATQPGTAVRQYVFEDVTLPNHLTGIIDENSDRFATWGYDTKGRAILSEHAGSKESVTIAYNPNGTTTVTLGNGATRDYTFSVQQGQRRTAMITGDVCSVCPGGEIADRTYDANGFADEVIDWNLNTTQTLRNARGLTETLIEAKGSTEQRTTTTTWHANYRLPTQIVSPKNTTDFTHDVDGNVLTVTVSSGALSRAWTMTYNASGQPLTIDGPRTDVSDMTTLVYYTCTTGNECGQLNTVTNALSQITTYNSYDAAGRPTLITDPNGLQSSFTYDWRGNVLTLTATPVTGTPRATTMTYDDAGQLETISTPDGMVLTYIYSAAHYLTSVTDNLGSHIDYDYDAMGNLIDEDTYNAGSTLKRAIDYAYDLNNRLDTVTNGGFLTDLTLDLVGNLTNEVDPELASTTHNYDALNRLDQTIDALTGVIDYGYDAHDNITSVTAANGAATSYVYDNLDNLTQETSPDRGTITYTYDEAGNRKTELDARGKLTSYTYDALNRLTLVTLNGGGTITYEYDVGTNAIGRLDKITDSSGTTAWTYDNFGAVTQKVQTVGAVSLTTGYGYDTAGRLSTMTYPSGKVVTYAYNTYLPVSVSVDGNTILSSAAYDPFGPVNGWTWGNGSFASRNFDLRGLAASIDFASDTQTLGYDNAGQVISQSDTVLDVAYDYDLLGRLTDFTNNNGGGGGGSPAGPMFSTAPVILASIQSATNESATPPATNPSPWITAGVRNTSATGVELTLERSEVNSGSVSSAENIGYIAITDGAAGTFSANSTTITYEAQTTTDSIKGWQNGCYTTNFASSFTSTPTVVATKTLHGSGEGGWIRRCSLTSSAIGLTVDEDQYRDNERRHNTEAAGLMAFSQDFDVQVDDGVAIWGMEAATIVLPVTMVGSTFVQVNFRQSYTTPPIIVALATNETSDPAAIRIKDVTTTGFKAAQVEPATSDGTQGAMTMHYLAVEPGTHELPDGTRILADTVSTTSVQHGNGVSGSESWAVESFASWPGTSSSPMPASQVMAYDANGNRTSLTEDTVLYSYSNLLNSNRLLSTSGPVAKTYTYDVAGNATSDGVHSYGYDDRGRLVDVDSGAATYVHNGQGQRVKKDNGTVTLFAYDEIGGLIGEYDSVGAAVKETVWFNGAPVAVLDGANRYYVHTDQLGTPRVITDGNTVIWRWHSDPFGSTGPDEDADGDQVDFTYNLRFAGQYYDSETALHYNYFRTYDPSTGRYLKSDPIGLDGGLNTYGYVYQNPLSFTDPTGEGPYVAYACALVAAAGVVSGLSELRELEEWMRQLDEDTEAALDCVYGEGEYADVDRANIWLDHIEQLEEYNRQYARSYVTSWVRGVGASLICAGLFFATTL